MFDRLQCDFRLIRYVPDTLRNEFVNIGVIFRQQQGGVPVVRFTRDWTRVRCLDPEADVGMLEALEEEIRARLASEGTVAGQSERPILGVLEDSFSNTVQVTNEKACLAESVIAEVESLMRLYVEARKQPGRSRRSGRSAIQASMRSHFERARVWALMNKRIAAATYTRPGDPLQVDCGYRPNGIIRMFHAVSLENDLELAKVLAFSAPELRTGVTRVEAASLELTAIVEPLRQIRSDEDDEESLARYRFGVDAMEAQAIRVMTTADLPRIAETAKRELRVE